MKLRQSDVSAIEDIIVTRPKHTVLPVENGTRRAIVDIAAILKPYGLGDDDALDAAARLVNLDKSRIASHLAVDQRSVKTILKSADPQRLPDGRIQLHMRGERPLQKFLPRSRWKPQDAIDMKHHMARFYESPFGIWAAVETVQRAEMDERHAHEAAAEAHRLWSNSDLLLIFAKDSYLDMLDAAAITAPTGPLNDDELLAPSGVLFFERERNLAAITAASGGEPVRGIAWYVEEGHLTVQVFVDGHHELNNPGTIEPPTDTYAYLYLRDLLKVTMRNPSVPGQDDGVNALLGYLRSIRGIAQSPATADATVTPKAPKKRKGSVSLSESSVGLRVLSLRNAEHGKFELDAATGRKVRQHWVRGHWRNQWYPSLLDNRSIWIDGYIKGDASAGTVTGPKVHVAR